MDDEDLAANRWWDSLTRDRRVGIHRWIEGMQKQPTGEVPGQLTIDGREVRHEQCD